MGSGRALITLWAVASAIAWVGWMLLLNQSCIRQADGRLWCQSDDSWLPFLRGTARDPFELALMGLVPSVLILIVGIALFRALRRT
ncbi:hypothetical protein [Reyranella sp.]|uniref:hypothetical protein n=1 Tax=Reyranella sp. TaxID=1929291 RepID=UPI003BAAE696